MADISLLDQSVPKLLEAAADLSLEDLAELMAAERIGKTRVGAMKGLMELYEAKQLEPEIEEPEGGELIEAEPLNPDISWENPNVITNCIPGTCLHLGDGRRLAHGESAQVSAELAAQLRESGQAG